jgi:outer membrane protein OmpA-like peptidoglycan-associated protein/Tfp pilus assembly protein PilF
MLAFKPNLRLTSLLLLAFGFVSSSLFAQENKERAAQMVEIGDEIMSQTLAVIEARDMYITAVKMDPDNIRANYMAGFTTLHSINKGSAKEYFLRVLELDPEYSFDILYKIGQAYHYDYKFDEAINYYGRYQQKLKATGGEVASEFATLKEVDRKLYECEQGKILVEFPEEMKIKNVGEKINSSSDDYAPVVNIDETLLIFTSRRLQDNLNQDVASDNYPFEDIFFSTRTDSTWGNAQNIGQPVNTLYHDSNVGLSKDGTSLYIYKDDNGGDIFEARRDAEGNWSEPIPLGKPINTEYAETTVTLSPDGETMFFASNRKGGFGGLDIWITHKDSKGNWDKPENLGEEINTSLNEDGPFIGYDGKTLYFSSEGGEGMGGFDIYRVVYDSLSGAWEAPENMGYPINTPDHDVYFVPTEDGKNAFYSSVREDGFGGSDIYMLDIPQVLQHQEKPPAPKTKVTLQIKVYDEDNNLLDANLQLTEQGSSAKLYAVRKSIGTYHFVSLDSVTRQYELYVTDDGYEDQRVAYTIPGASETPKFIMQMVTMHKMPLPPVVLKSTSSKKLRNIYFDFNKSVIKVEYKDKVSKAVEYLKTHPGDKLLLEGHSDYIGAEKHNTILSKTRAENVKKAMVKQGISASRIQTKGLGSSKPLASNDNEREGRELNRRVEFKVLR